MTLRGQGYPVRDLDTRAEIHDLVIRFYREIVFDEVLAPVFEEVAEVDWRLHIPKLIDYWCRVLLGEPGYDGYILAAHRHVHELEAFEPQLFDRWYTLFVETVDAEWAGPRADAAKDHAFRVANVLSRQLLGIAFETATEPPPRAPMGAPSALRGRPVQGSRGGGSRASAPGLSGSSISVSEPCAVSSAAADGPPRSIHANATATAPPMSGPTT